MLKQTKRLFVVLGMHRSGTSAITRALEVFDINLGSELMPPVESANAKGYFEDIEINALNIEMLHSIGIEWYSLKSVSDKDVDFLNQEGYFLKAVDILRKKTSQFELYGIKDPRITKLLPFWGAVFEHCGFDINYVIATRNPISVAHSLYKREAFKYERSYLLWLTHVLSGLAHTQNNQKRLLIDYDVLLKQPKQTLKRVADFFSLTINTQSLKTYSEDFLDSSLQHTAYKVEDLTLHDACPRLVAEVYAELIDKVTSHKTINTNEFYKKTTHWCNELDKLQIAFGIVDDLYNEVGALTNHLSQQTSNITSLISTAVKYDQNIFKRVFNPQWYLLNNPDVAAVGIDAYKHYIEHGLPENRLPSPSLSSFVGDALIDYAQAFKKIENLSIKLEVERNETNQANFAQKLQLQEVHEQKITKLAEQAAVHEREINEKLAQANQQLLSQLSNMVTREQAHIAQVSHLQEAHEQKISKLALQAADNELGLIAKNQAEQDELYARLAHQLQIFEQQSESITALKYEIFTINNSYSWRLTRPFRTLASIFTGKKYETNMHKFNSDIASSNIIDNKGLGNVINTTPNRIDISTITLKQHESPSTMADNHKNEAINSVAKLLSFYDEHFIYFAYQSILGRIPDKEGLSYYLKRLRSGISKIELLAQLRISKEGKNINASIDGLDKLVRQYKLSKMPIFGGLFNFNKVNLAQSLSALENKVQILEQETKHRLLEMKSSIEDFKKINQTTVELPDKKILQENFIDQFDSDWYLAEYADVAESGMSSYDHYMTHGKAEGRYPRFHAEWYLKRYPDISASGVDPYEHYKKHGKLEGRFPIDLPTNLDGNNYPKWVTEFDTLTPELRDSMLNRIKKFKQAPLISVVMPVYNPNPEWLKLAIESVRSQIYPNWEMCIADDVSTNSEIKPILEHYAKIDKRIKVVFRKKNGHISQATNSALELVSGEWVALLDHDDTLSEHALFWVADAINQKPNTQLIYSDEDKIDEKGQRFGPYFKCDWNQDLFYSHNMFSHLGVYKTELVRKVKGFRVGLEGSQDYDLALRCIEQVKPEQIHHIPRVLYHWRMHAESTAHSADAKPYAMIAGEKAINEHFERTGVDAKAKLIPYGYRVSYSLPKNLPLVSLIIPTRNGLNLIKQCIESILTKTTYKNYEILIVDNGSDDAETLKYLKKIATNKNIKVIRDDGPFNYSAINNNAVRQAKGEIIGLINNDIEVISPDWLSEMVSHAIRPEVGCVGAKLLYPNDDVQHAGVLLGVTGVAAHPHRNIPRNAHGYFSRANLIQSFSAVTAACLLVRKSTYESLGGLDEVNLKVAFNDVDFCIRVRDAGFRNIWTPYAELYHHESATRGQEDNPEKLARFNSEISFMMKHRINKPDPAYSPNLTTSHEDFSLAWPPRMLEESN